MNRLHATNQNLQSYEILRITFSKELQTLPEIEALKYNKTRVFTGCDGKPDICEKTVQHSSHLIASFLASDRTECEQKTVVDRRLLNPQTDVTETLFETISVPRSTPVPATKIESDSPKKLLPFISLASIALVLGIISSKVIFQSSPFSYSTQNKLIEKPSSFTSNSNYVYNTAASEYLSTDSQPKIIAHFPNSERIAIARAQQLTIAQLDSFAEVISVPINLSSKPSAIAISSDGLQVAIGDLQGKIVIWDKTTEHLQILDNHFPISGLAFSHFSNKLVATDKSGAISFFSHGKEIAHLFGHESAIDALAIDRRDNIITGDKEGIIKIWNARGELITTFKDSAGITNLVVQNRDNLYSSNSLGIVRQWDLFEGTEISSFYWKDRTITSLDIANNHLITGSQSGEIRVKDLNNLSSSQVLGGTGAIDSLLSSNNNKYILTVTNERINIWQKDE